jgi:dihydrofolate synthase/folylpolyglutamate synthase
MRTFADVERHLNSLINYESTTPLGGTRGQPKLEPVLQAAERLGLALELPRCAHIAGTVGKGSVAAMLNSILSRNFSTLTFTSPHLISVKERVTLNGESISDELWCDGFLEIVEGLSRQPKINLTYFEAVWVFYLWCARKLNTQAHVVETGLGGSFDATNVLLKSVAVFTKIDLDHTHILGKTPEEIALDKSGIIKQGCVAVTTKQSDTVLRVLEEKARAMHARAFAEERDFSMNNVMSFSFPGANLLVENLSWPLRGDFQRHNAATAIAAALRIEPELSVDDIREGLRSVRVEARQQTVKGYPNLWVDVAHNAASFAALAESLRADCSFQKTVALIAMLKDKDADASLANLKDVVDEVLVTDVENPRSRSTENLFECANRAGLSARVVKRDEGFEEILRLPNNTRGVVCGSFYLVGDFLRWMNARTA